MGDEYFLPENNLKKWNKIVAVKIKRISKSLSWYTETYEPTLDIDRAAEMLFESFLVA